MKQIREFLLFLILVVFAFGYALAQAPAIQIQSVSNTIHIDGKLDEADWTNTAPTGNFG